jgi:hypothetical protein
LFSPFLPRGFRPKLDSLSYFHSFPIFVQRSCPPFANL